MKVPVSFLRRVLFLALLAVFLREGIAAEALGIADEAALALTTRRVRSTC